MRLPEILRTVFTVPVKTVVQMYLFFLCAKNDYYLINCFYLLNAAH